MSKNKTAIVARESQSERCPVIEVRVNEVFAEHFVIPYGEEQPLRELTPGPSIVGIGFDPRETAVGLISDDSSRVDESKNSQEKIVLTHEKDQGGLQLRRERARQRVGFTEARRMASSTVRHAVATGVLMFYSRSILGAAIRAFVGA